MPSFARLFVLISLNVLCTAFASAEVRTWKAASGGYSVQATFVELKPGDVVRLKATDGRDLDVPLAQLSDADRQYVKQQSAGGVTTLRFTKTQRAVDRCRLPSDGLVIWQVFHDDPQTGAAEKQLALARIAELKDLAAKNMRRLNKKWVPEAEAEAVRKQADELMRQGLELLKLGNEPAFRQKFAAAGAIEPEEIRADFLTAMIYFDIRVYDKAVQFFQKCLVRDPENVIVMNNLALVAAAQNDWSTAAAHWRRALDLQPDHRIVHNVGRFLEQLADSIVILSPTAKSARDSLMLPYTQFVASGKFESTDQELGWIFLYLDESALDIDFRDKDEEKPVDVRPQATEDGPVIGNGTGFVVHPGYVLTNAHVAVDDATFEIQLSDGTLLKATRVAKADNLDLALLKCEELSAPPLPLSPDITPRGTDIMVLGYPSMSALGSSLKATRGSISSIPDPPLNDHYYYDAVTNPGNSGGPVCDDRGNVVAVHYIGTATASRYGGGISSPQALNFIRTSLPNVQPLALKTEKLDWPKVDAVVSPSTVLIWIRMKNAATATTAMSVDCVELKRCLFCRAEGKMACPAPGCVKGQLIRNGNRITCPICDGKGVLTCNVCKGARVDLKLASVQALLKKAAATSSSTSGARPPSSTKSARPSTDPADQPATGSPVELLPLIDLAQHKIHGEWTVEDAKLVGGGLNSSRVQIPYEPPPEYDVHVTAELLYPGDGGLIMGLVAGKQQFYISLREDGCGISVGGVINNEFKQTGEKYPLRQPTKITFRVRHNLITVLYEGNPAYVYRDDQTKLRLASSMAMPNPRELFIGSGGPGLKWSISRITLVPVDGALPAGMVIAPNKHRYQFVKDKAINWTQAKAKCEEMGGYLVCITSAEEQSFLIQSLPPTGNSEATGQKYWIGGLVRNGLWQWVSGESFHYSPNSPKPDPGRPYLRFLGGTNRWLGMDDQPGLTEGYICEWNK
jgi:S1-C subfamily serine protease